MRLPFVTAAVHHLDRALRELVCARLGAPHFGSWSTGVYACDVCRRVLNDPGDTTIRERPPAEEGRGRASITARSWVGRP